MSCVFFTRITTRRAQGCTGGKVRHEIIFQHKNPTRRYHYTKKTDWISKSTILNKIKLFALRYILNT
ncbi:uncharacterized protein VTP21DRAFT_1828 [Calcarisporiella thermophila]|uniref:uncharacterized protein n=1 Tax=Calcarisporiella thermophila TaxID=911321 RepID=UPI003742E334